MADPKLKTAMNEIMEILKKHDIAGQVTLVSQTHSEFRMKVDPSWSCAWMEEVPAGAVLRFRATKESIPDKELRSKTVEFTMHILLQIRDLCGRYFMALDNSQKELGKYMKIDHTPGSNYEPHVED